MQIIKDTTKVILSNAPAIYIRTLAIQIKAGNESEIVGGYRHRATKLTQIILECSDEQDAIAGDF